MEWGPGQVAKVTLSCQHAQTETPKSATPKSKPVTASLQPHFLALGRAQEPVPPACMFNLAHLLFLASTRLLQFAGLVSTALVLDLRWTGGAGKRNMQGACGTSDRSLEFKEAMKQARIDDPGADCIQRSYKLGERPARRAANRKRSDEPLC